MLSLELTVGANGDAVNWTISPPPLGKVLRGGDTGPPKMVGTDRNRLEAGAGEERKRGGGGRKDSNRHCRYDSNICIF